LGLKDFPRALKDYDQAIKLSGAQASHYQARAKLHRLMGKNAAASKDESTAAKLKAEKPK
ncbi:MAG TPA: hypothetical protein PK671_17560, partial [Candidatus Obscuribacter sp.]|nr:hypothetical protein [Candidatus Obscuribacter sp.]